MTSEASQQQPAAHRLLTLDTLTAIRTLADETSRGAGLSADRAARLALAADEAMTNAVRYAGGGAVTITATTGVAVTIEVRDTGPGIPSGTTTDLPAPDAIRGRGLWLMHTLCDEIDIDTGPAGTTVRLTDVISPSDEMEP